MIKMVIVSIREVLEQQREREFEGWLYLPPAPWTLITEGIFMMEDIDAPPAENFPPKLLDPCNLYPALDAAGIEDVIAYARQKKDNLSATDLLESFKFYVENDAFLD